MKSLIAVIMLTAGLGVANAQAPAAAPAGATGQCKDGSYSDAASKRGACAGHKGVKEWYATDAAVDAKTPKPALAAAPVKATAPSIAAPATAATSPSAAVVPAASTAVPKTSAATRTVTAGGGNGQVWVNPASKVYHCEGTKYYGTTKAGSYMTEAAAISAGNHADHGKACKAS
ncbi:MAG: DUF3761 domain-containing protein [Burkholderiaceae bacterium]